MGVFAHGPIDIALVGDSFTHGYCVEQGEDIGGQLRQMGHTVINLGMGANGPLLELAALKEFAEPLQPGIVLWVYYEGNDLKDLDRDAASPLLLRYLEGDFSQNLRYRQTEVDALLMQQAQARMQQAQWVIQQKQPAILLVKFLKLWRVRNLVGLAPVPASQNTLYRHRQPIVASLRLLARVLRRAADMVTAWNGQIYLVYLPSWERYTKDVEPETFQHKDQVLSIAQDLNLPVIDIDDVLQCHDNPLSLIPFKGRGHFTEEGYRLIAEAIAAHLR